MHNEKKETSHVVNIKHTRKQTKTNKQDNKEKQTNKKTKKLQSKQLLEISFLT